MQSIPQSEKLVQSVIRKKGTQEICRAHRIIIRQVDKNGRIRRATRENEENSRNDFKKWKSFDN